MNINEMDLFLTLCKTRHFQKASSLCNISPSAFSRAINRIEDEVGQKLFERNNRAVSLTPSGAVFRDYAEKMVKLWKDGKYALAHGKDKIAGELSIYCSVTAAYGILPDILDVFRHKYPDVHITLKTGDAESALGQLKQGDTDIAIAAIPTPVPDFIEHIHVTTTPLVWINSKKNPMEKDDINWQTTPLILPKQGIARNSFDQWSRRMNIHPEIYAEVTGNEAIIAMVHLGCGIGLVPEMVLEKSPVADTISILDFVPPLAPYSIGICANRKKKGVITDAFWQTANEFA
ncbi:MAG: HTH-type transcriptional activator IlvY [Proteobacteria bacterium]|nr:HTH-type transcriptional activator IlvY [Pseudomonadota bacterium]